MWVWRRASAEIALALAFQHGTSAAHENGCSAGVVGLLLAGCAYDAPPRLFEVKNLTAERLTLQGAVGPSGKFYAEPGGLIHIPVEPRGCDSYIWLAISSSGTVVAQLSGGCLDHRWTIRGVNDSTYE